MIPMEYPRPQFYRERYQMLDGLWQYSLPEGERGQIRVPYVYQSAASGIGKPLPGGRITYERDFEVPADWQGQRVLLHFGAVDYRASVYVNGRHVISHEGGQTPFTADITPCLKKGPQRLRVEVSDEQFSDRIPRGKQSWTGRGSGIFYTPSTGIWQSVWLECAPAAALTLLRYTPDAERGQLRVEIAVSEACPLPCRVDLTASLAGQDCAHAAVTLCEPRGDALLDLGHGKAILGGHFDRSFLWSPEHPTLFDLEARLTVDGQAQDRVQSYFGLRRVECREGRIYLNGRECPQRLILDQGYWPEGLMTPPEVDAFRVDIEAAKQMGFNGCRKHEKAEDPRFLHWADRLGYLVWGSMSSFYRFDETAASRHMADWAEILRRDYNHPCVVCWDMLNESWGVPDIREDKRQQAYADSLYALAHALDGTRPAISNDGWEQTRTDVCALHSYRHGGPQDQAQRACFRRALASLDALDRSGLLEEKRAFAQGYAYGGQPVVLSEYGGMSLPGIDGWGYNTAADPEEFLRDYEDLIRVITESGLFCGFCYTQLTDVEQEQNGLLTADRRFKLPPERLRAILDKYPLRTE